MTDIAVLIPHYNNMAGLYKSLASIAGICPVDVVIVDDGSTLVPDQNELSNKFPDIHAIYAIALPYNQGIEHALNAGLKFIKKAGRYQYIARLDCGDRCKPDRFLVQKSFLEDNLEIYLLGSGVEMTDMAGKTLYSVYYPATALDIRRKMYTNNMFCHPAVMFRSTVMDHVGDYPVMYPSAEDYAFFFNIVEKFDTANMQEILLYCELNPQGISQLKRKAQLRSRIRIILAHWRWRLPAVYGLLRNVAIYLAPQFLILRLKQMNNGIKY